MKTGDVVFVRDETLYGDLIRFVDKGPFDHVIFFISDDKVIEANINGGVTINGFLYADCYHEVISTNPTLEQQPIIDTLAKKYVGEDYDLSQIFRLFLEIEFGWEGIEKFNNDKEVVCSELVGYFLIAIGKADKSVINMSPNELYAYMKK